MAILHGCKHWLPENRNTRTSDLKFTADDYWRYKHFCEALHSVMGSQAWKVMRGPAGSGLVKRGVLENGVGLKWWLLSHAEQKELFNFPCFPSNRACRSEKGQAKLEGAGLVGAFTELLPVMIQSWGGGSEAATPTALPPFIGCQLPARGDSRPFRDPHRAQ